MAYPLHRAKSRWAAAVPWAMLALVMLLLAGCASKKGDDDDAPEAEPIRPVQLTPVERGSIDRVIEADGILRALDQSTVTPKISAPVSKFLVNRGDHVKAGQLVAVLENKDLQASVADAKGAYEQAQSTYRNVSAATVPDEVTKAQADVQAAQHTMDAAKTLLDNRQKMFEQGALARKLVDDATVTYAQAKSQYDTAQRHLQSVQSVARIEDVKTVEGQRDSAQAKYEAAQAQLSYSEIHSPIAGVVADRPLFEGEIASPTAPLMTIMDISSVIARLNVPQAQAGYIKLGQPARIVSTDGASATGKVTVVSPAVDPQGTTVEIWVQAPNPGEKLRPGETVHASIVTQTVRDALILPPAALLPSSEGGTAVFTVGADMVAHEHKVDVGIRTADKVQILSGVNAGDRAISAGGLGLEDGAKVKLEQAGDSDKDDDKGGGKDGAKDDGDKK